MAYPKVHDNRSLQTLLGTTRNRLLQINGFDQASLLTRLGTLQGANAAQTQFGLQISGLPLPGTTTNANSAVQNTTATTDTNTSQKAGATAPDTTTDNKIVTNSPTSSLTTQVNVPQVQPSSVTLPTLPALGSPGGLGVSSLDLLGEQVQLNYEIVNLQLLLEGSLSDEFVSDTTHTQKRQMTLGFPISISVPPGYKYRGAAAEVEISVCNKSGPSPINEAPSLVTILPREKTYNVANIVSKSVSIAGGAVAGVINLGGSFLHGRQTYYLAKDQDTLAIQQPPTGSCSYKEINKGEKQTALTFAWQFRPVLGEKVIRDGLRQTFAQIAFPPGLKPDDAYVTITTSWRRYDPKTGRIGERIETSVPIGIPVPALDLTPMARSVAVDDNGDGTLTIRANGGFLAGTRVRIVNILLDASSPGFEQNDVYLKFVASAAAIALQGAKLVNRDGTEADIITPMDISTPIPGKPQQDSSHPVAQVTPLKDSNAFSSVSLKLEKPDTSTGPLPRVIIGSQVFGSGDTPFTEHDANHVVFEAPNELLRCSQQLVYVSPPNSIVFNLPEPSAAERCKKENKEAKIDPFTDTISHVTLRLDPPDIQTRPDVPIVLIGSRIFGLRDTPFASSDRSQYEFLVPNDLLRNNTRITWIKLFSASQRRQDFTIPEKFRSAVAGLTLLLSSNGENTYAVTGAALDKLKILVPKVPNPTVNDSKTMATFSLNKDQLDGLKNIVLQHDADPPIILALPTGTLPDTKPSLDKHTPINVGDKSITITGSGLDQIVNVHYLEKPLLCTLAVGYKNSLTIQLPDTVTLAPGIQVLEFIYADKTSVRYEVAVQVKPAQ